MLVSKALGFSVIEVFIRERCKITVRAFLVNFIHEGHSVTVHQTCQGRGKVQCFTNICALEGHFMALRCAKLSEIGAVLGAESQLSLLLATAASATCAGICRLGQYTVSTASGKFKAWYKRMYIYIYIQYIFYIYMDKNDTQKHMFFI